MPVSYPKFGYRQPKNTCRVTSNQNFDIFGRMREIDSVKFGRRVRERRVELGLSQIALGRLSGHSQSNIGWIEGGSVKKAQRAAYELAGPLQTTAEWLLWELGPKQLGPRHFTTAQMAEKYDEMPPELKSEITQAIEKLEKSNLRKKRSS